MAKLILASASPRRSELLKQIGVKFDVFPSEVDESVTINNPVKYVEDLSLKKATWVAERRSSGVILAADTIVVYKKEILGKPKGQEDAKAMLKKLSGDTHDVITGFVLLDMAKKKHIVSHCITRVHFKELTDDIIDRYIATLEFRDKAGSYAIQGYGAVLVDRIEGDYFNVVGLPISKLVNYLQDFNIKVFGG